MSTHRTHKKQIFQNSESKTVSVKDLLISVSRLRTGDHVVVLGRKTLDYLIELVRSGCRNAVASNPSCPGHLSVSADIVWLIGAEALDGAASLIQELGNPRMVALVLHDHDAKDGLNDVLTRLRAKGLVTVTTHWAADGSVIVAARPTWLRQVH